MQVGLPRVHGQVGQHHPGRDREAEQSAQEVGSSRVGREPDASEAGLQLRALFRFREVALPSTYGRALHVHPLQEERFVVIRGRVEFVMGTRKIVCIPGESVVVPAGVRHTFKNAADYDVRPCPSRVPAVGSPAAGSRFAPADCTAHGLSTVRSSAK